MRPKSSALTLLTLTRDRSEWIRLSQYRLCMVSCVVSFCEQVSNKDLEYIVVYIPVLLGFLSFVRLTEFIERWLDFLHSHLDKISTIRVSHVVLTHEHNHSITLAPSMTRRHNQHLRLQHSCSSIYALYLNIRASMQRYCRRSVKSDQSSMINAVTTATYPFSFRIPIQ
jgi:hypothetical protein